MQTYDALVVGGGYIGCSVAYHLSKAGLKTALVEQKHIGSGASQGNFGNIQVQDAELEYSLPMVKAGLERFASLEGELGMPVHLRPYAGILLIENESQWRTMEKRMQRLHQAGINSELVTAKHVAEIEPLIDGRAILGMLYYPHEGQVYPFHLMAAYIKRGREAGLDVLTHTTVTDFHVEAGRLTGVATSRGAISAAATVLTTGAWTRPLGRLLDRDWPVHHIHAQAVATEPVQLCLRGHVASAAFFEAMSGEDESSADSAILALSQSPHGNFLLGEATRATEAYPLHSTAGAFTAIAGQVVHYLPALANLKVIRGWAANVAHTDDGRPLFGAVADLPGLYLATAFRSTVIVTPLAGETMTELITTGRSSLDLSAFSPDRFAKAGA